MKEENVLRFAPVPLRPEADLRIRTRIRAEARARRVLLAEATLHGGFAVAMTIWAFAMVFG